MNKFECSECGTRYSSPETTPPPGIKWSDGHVCTPKPVNKQNMKPIHKLNNGRGATLCHKCTVIITTGLTKDLYCEKCKPKLEDNEQKRKT